MPTNRRVVEKSDVDAYATPLWATQLLLDQEKFDGPIWECCAGAGNISAVLLNNGYTVYSSDLYTYNRIQELPVDHIIQPNTDALQINSQIDNIITNPPYSQAEEFVSMCLENATKKFALLLRLAFLEGSKRYDELFRPDPPTRVYVYSDRVSMYPFGDDRKSGGTTAYAWYVWDMQDEVEHTEIKWLYYDPLKEHKFERPKRTRKKKEQVVRVAKKRVKRLDGAEL